MFNSLFDHNHKKGKLWFDELKEVKYFKEITDFKNFIIKIL